MQNVVRFYQTYYETYGRTVELIPFIATGGAADEVAARADAVRIAEEIQPFVVWQGPALTPAFGDELAARGVMCISCVPGQPTEFYEERAPYVWAIDGSQQQKQDHVFDAELALVRQRDRNLRARVADHVVVGQHVAIGGDDDTGAEALLKTIAIAKRAIAAEELAEKRIVCKRRVRCAHDLRRRDVGNARNRELRRDGQIGRGGGCRRNGASLGGRGCCSDGLVPRGLRDRVFGRTHPAGEHEAGDETKHEKDNPEAESSHLRREDLNPAPRLRRRFRERNGQHAVGEIGGNLVDGNRVGKLEPPRERSVAALDLMEMNDVGCRDAIGTATADGQLTILEHEIDLIACEARHFSADDEGRICFVNVDGRCPWFGILVAQTAESVLQNAEFPGHERMVARGLTGLSRFCYDR